MVWRPAGDKTPAKRVPGGTPAMRPDQALQPTSRAGTGPAPQTNTFFGRLVVIFGSGASTGLFVYNGTPALGNPPIFSITTSSTDPFGNPVPANTVNATNLALIAGAITAQTMTLNPGPLLEYGTSGLAVQLFTASGTFTPPATFVAGSAQVLAIGAGDTGAVGLGTGTGGQGGHGGASAYNGAAPFTALTGYPVTVPAAGSASPTTITTDAATISAPSGNAGGAAGTGPAGTTGAAGGVGGQIHSNPGGGGGGGGAGLGVAGGAGAVPAGGIGGPASGLFPGGGTGGKGGTTGNGSAGTGYGAGGGGAPHGFTGGAGTAGMVFIIYQVTGGTTGLINSMATAAGTDPNTGTAYSLGVWNYNPALGTSAGLTSGTLTLGAAGGNAVEFSSSGWPVVAAGDGNTYDMTRLTLPGTALPQTINSVTPAAVTGISANVAAGTYLVRGQMVYQPAGAAGAGLFSFGGSSTIAGNVAWTEWIIAATGVAGSVQAVARPGVTSSFQTTTFTAAERMLRFEGLITVSVAGTLTLTAACTVAIDTFQMQVGTYMDLLPVVA